MSVNETLNERKKTHGDFADFARITQSIKYAIFDGVIESQGLTPLEWFTHQQREAIEMIAHKLGRVAAGDPNVADHWHDIAGYATLAETEIKSHERKDY